MPAGLRRGRAPKPQRRGGRKRFRRRGGTGTRGRGAWRGYGGGRRCRRAAEGNAVLGGQFCIRVVAAVVEVGRVVTGLAVVGDVEPDRDAVDVLAPGEAVVVGAGAFGHPADRGTGGIRVGANEDAFAVRIVDMNRGRDRHRGTRRDERHGGDKRPSEGQQSPATTISRDPLHSASQIENDLRLTEVPSRSCARRPEEASESTWEKRVSQANHLGQVLTEPRVEIAEWSGARGGRPPVLPIPKRKPGAPNDAPSRRTGSCGLHAACARPDSQTDIPCRLA